MRKLLTPREITACYRHNSQHLEGVITFREHAKYTFNTMKLLVLVHRRQVLARKISKLLKSINDDVETYEFRMQMKDL